MIQDLNASKLREWVAVFLMDAQPDGQGGLVETIPANLKPDRAAAVEPATGHIALAADQNADRLRYYVYIRFDVAITSSHRVLWRDTYWDIDGQPQNVDMADTWLRLTVQRREGGTQ